MDANARAEEEGRMRRDRQGCVGVIRESLGDSDPYSENAMHLLPCCINYTGPAEVSTYFKPTEMGKRRTLFFLPRFGWRLFVSKVFLQASFTVKVIIFLKPLAKP
jgi:hypothetical protein